MRNKSLRTNLPYTLCRLYGHYYHHYQELAEFWDTLSQFQKHSLESEVTAFEEIHPPVSSSTTTTIYMISSSNTPSVSSPMEDLPDLSWHHCQDDGEIYKTTTSFTPFPFNHGVELVLPIEGQILSPRLANDLCLDMGAHLFPNSDGRLLKNPCNGLHLKRSHA